jgi:primosomal protein N''
MSRLAAPVGFIAGQLGRQAVAALQRHATTLYIRRENKKADPEEIAAALVNLKPHIQYADAVVATRDIDRMALAAKEI